MNKIIISVFLAALVLACAGKEKSETGGAEVADGAQIFKKYCVLCHGVDGKLGLNGSKDITKSVLSKAERKELIRNGKNTMTPFGGVLTEAEIDAVAGYTMTLK